MLSYRHGFHAGHWADVHKHVAVVLLVRHLLEKPKPVVVVDAFAGDGSYALDSPEAVKTGAFREGIARLWPAAEAPPSVAPYVAAVGAANPSGRLATYPGTPALLAGLLRRDDRILLSELHPTAHANLVRAMRGDSRVTVHRRDGFEFVNAVAPPDIRRGLVIIDPSYEVKDDYARVVSTVVRAIAKWPEATYLAWYPVLREGRHREMLDAFRDLGAHAVLAAELAPHDRPGAGLQGTGLVVVRPPWRFDGALAEAGDWLAERLWTPAGRHRVRWLRPPPA
jgi:23S rRNA (adenine2030-N6)-methyltransferase